MDIDKAQKAYNRRIKALVGRSKAFSDLGLLTTPVGTLVSRRKKGNLFKPVGKRRGDKLTTQLNFERSHGKG